jgi:hypothetical protein
VTGQRTGFTAGIVASTAWPFGQMAAAQVARFQHGTGHHISGGSLLAC